MSAPLDIALGYIRRGWNPVPVLYREKKPVGTEWQHRVITEANAAQYFNGGRQNVGVQLGKLSGGLADVDLDCPEAIAIAPYILPPTKAIFGRTSARASHWLYMTDLADTDNIAVVNYKTTHEGHLAELRIGGGKRGAQTVGPGSFHKETGEEIAWEPGCDGEPANVDGRMLRNRVDDLAALTLIARKWPKKGDRHDAALALGGFLARVGRSSSEVGLAAQAVARAAGDPEWEDRVRAAKDHAEYYKNTGRGRGFPTLVKFFGDAAATRAAEWLAGGLYCLFRDDDGAMPGDASAAPSDKQSPTALNIINAGTDDWNVSPRGWLLGNIFCREYVSSILGDGGVGKTSLRYAQYLSLAIDRSLTGEYVFQRCRVLIISLEDSTDELRRRMKAACMHHGIPQAELNGWMFYIALGASSKLMVLDAKGRSVVGPLAADIEKTVIDNRIDLVALDPFVKTHSVEENNNSAIDDVVQILSDLASKHKIAVDVPHHISKGTAEPGNANRGRGASAAKDAFRLVYTLFPMISEEAEALGVSEAERRSLIRMDSGKVNTVPPMAEAKWFRLVGVDLGNPTETYPNGDNVQTVETWKPAEAFDNMSNAILNSILDDIAAGMSDGQLYSAHHNARSRAVWKVVIKHVPDKAPEQAKKIIKTWVKSGLLIEDDYHDEERGEEVKGVRVDNSKRPGTVL